jgi:hypothetical protein
MKVVSGRASNGKVAFEVPEAAEGEEVTAVILEEESVALSPEEKKLLLESIASGEVDDGLDALEALDAMRDPD